MFVFAAVIILIVILMVIGVRGSMPEHPGKHFLSGDIRSGDTVRENLRVGDTVRENFSSLNNALRI